MEKELTQEQRISVIRYAHGNSKEIATKRSVEDFLADIKSEDVAPDIKGFLLHKTARRQAFAEHGLLDSQKEDLEDESQFLNSDSAENIDEEDQGIGVSDQMKGVYK
jgi:hypothetical protein